MRPRCSFPGCGRIVYAKGICPTHYAQRKKGKPLTPIRVPGQHREWRFLSFRVTPEVREALGPKPGVKARAILEDWIKQQEPKR